MPTKTKILEQENKILKRALFDVLDGNASPQDIKYSTGLPDKRCSEINKIYVDLVLMLNTNPDAF